MGPRFLQIRYCRTQLLVMPCMWQTSPGLWTIDIGGQGDKLEVWIRCLLRWPDASSKLRTTKVCEWDQENRMWIPLFFQAFKLQASTFDNSVVVKKHLPSQSENKTGVWCSLVILFRSWSGTISLPWVPNWGVLLLLRELPEYVGLLSMWTRPSCVVSFTSLLQTTSTLLSPFFLFFPFSPIIFCYTLGLKLFLIDIPGKKCMPRVGPTHTGMQAYQLQDANLTFLLVFETSPKNRTALTPLVGAINLLHLLQNQIRLLPLRLPIKNLLQLQIMKEGGMILTRLPVLQPKRGQQLLRA